jgi:hypothetical protein
MKTTLALSLLLLAGLAAGCGPGDTHTAGTPVEGTYVLDVDRTPPAAGSGGGGDASRSDDEARRTRLRAKFGPESYRMDVLPDGTFRTTLVQPDGPFVFTGTWSRVPEGLRLVTTAVNGDAPPEDAGTVETAAVEEGALVLTDGDRTVYLKKV